MEEIYLHEHNDFGDLLRILQDETGILDTLIEKDYWIMHSLYGLKKQGYSFQLKGGTSLSKAYGIIDRFSEDIDIHIDPPAVLGINENPKNEKPANSQKKKEYYDQLAAEINIPGIIKVTRDTEYDNTKNYNSGGIRLFYHQLTATRQGIKDGILLEAGYDTVMPNKPVTITSWAYEKAKSLAAFSMKDNRAKEIICYDPRYTFVEKLQTIATKYRVEQATGKASNNYMRQYYDIYCLLGQQSVIDFLGTDAYQEHKKRRFPKPDLEIPAKENEAFLLTNTQIRASLELRYQSSRDLYYKGQPSLSEILERIANYIHLM
ncbi:nucleotidyl transferase AbiEii/AbiGii toxin family protein [Niabella pedocola]|uniref:Nucleotidyl transferase AbiEii/AbiGii toxin family protein n=1 Tax=Niabella pedocola TaxID=1752077 RepID=A0ABS8PWR9_9BACT|nr:nucleotidyl transferase AbiEii/AbiGii toxin family protein [Niabella pedocola]MCD2424326.1 nucleotidyl transferase AbiEii/AbiGii toxin family protein [Niabella pedocola]